MSDDFNIKDVIPDVNDKLYQKMITVENLKNPERYVGKSEKIVIRSSWESLMVKFFDTHKCILEWCSEEIVIPYISPIDNRKHNYYPDFYCKTINKYDKIREWLIEIKPFKETIKPKIKSTYKTSTKVESMKRYLTNIAKWESAREFCQKRAMKFRILTERELGV